MVDLRTGLENFGKVRKKTSALGRKEGLGIRQATAPPTHEPERLSHICPLVTLPVVTAHSRADADAQRGRLRSRLRVETPSCVRSN